ncbi:oxygenase MpaB family protein [Promicromonospora sp. NPDC060271]|uniref:oxygenase MpaB family protein n=1 Tax=Promicromonospora sp. NPDC060271 TaxID=3347089 RepID=UPI00365B6C6B
MASTTDDVEQPAAPAYPLRFRSAEARGARIGRPLRLLGRARDVDEALLDRIGRAFFEQDDAGAALAAAMRLPVGTPGRVTHKQLRTALAGGAMPEPLRRFLDEVTAVPDWVDWELVEEGAAVQRRLGQNSSDVLLQLSLVGGYRFGGPTDLLAATGALTGGALRRLEETQEWTVGLSEPGALRPYAPAWRATVHVRLMHALVNASFADPDPSTDRQGGRDRWDTARWGLPINQADQAATLGLFDGTQIFGCRALGVPVPPSDSRALMHLWRWVGHLLGVHPDFLVDDEWQRHRLNYHVLLAQAGISEAGPLLARAVVAAQAERTYPGPSWWQPFRAGFERERLLSMLTTFLGVRSMRELGLPLRPAWAHAYLLPLNTWRYRVLGRGRRGRERLDRWGRRRSAATVASYRTVRS